MEADKTTREGSLKEEDAQHNDVDIVDIVEETKVEMKRVSPDHEDQEDIKEQNNKQTTDNKGTTKEQQSDINSKFTIARDEGSTDDETTRSFADDCDFLDFSPVTLLRGTVSELEHALRDSRALMKTRDAEIVGFRKEIEKGRDQVHKEQMKWQRKATVVDERNREIVELKRKLIDSEKSNEELQERIKEFESPFSESDSVSPCCSSMKELVEVKLELAERDLLLNEIQINNCTDTNEKSDDKNLGTRLNKKAIVANDGWKTGSDLRPTAGQECEQHNQLKLKFLRDAFFYFMIDFHSEEQMKAILAVLAYGDQREDVIKQAYRMRQRGKKFTVKEVSSRGLSFLHEEI